MSHLPGGGKPKETKEKEKEKKETKAIIAHVNVYLILLVVGGVQLHIQVSKAKRNEDMAPASSLNSVCL